MGSTIDVGDYVYVTDIRVAPVKKDDPYLQRIFVMAIKVDKVTGFHEVPDTKKSEGSNNFKIYMLDPRGLEILSEEETSRMVECVNRTYDTKE